MCLAAPGRIMAIFGESALRTARIDYGGLIKEASLAFLPDARAGDYVIVHAGVAISQLDEAAADRALEEIERLAIDTEKPEAD